MTDFEKVGKGGDYQRLIGSNVSFTKLPDGCIVVSAHATYISLTLQEAGDMKELLNLLID